MRISKIQNRPILDQQLQVERFLRIILIITIFYSSAVSILFIELFIFFNDFSETHWQILVCLKLVPVTFYIIKFINDRLFADFLKVRFSNKIFTSFSYFILILFKALILFSVLTPSYFEYKVMSCKTPNFKYALVGFIQQLPDLLLLMMMVGNLKLNNS